MKGILRGKKVLITGGAGSVGRALARELLKWDLQTIRTFDISENELFEMKNQFGTERKMRYLIGDIRDIERVRMAMEDIDVVVHLAAMKHVYACEYNPFEAIKTNINGLQNVIDVARDQNVEKLIFCSTDKAASPTNVMGITKLLGEKLISLANFYKGNKRTIFSSVRFGNVIGSNGSVVPLFRKQIGAGGPVTITDKEMTRFIITMDEAVNLICKAMKLAKGGETYTCKMRSVKVMDLANVMITKYGWDKKIEMESVGRGPGEKLHEEIMTEEELCRAVELENLYVIYPVVEHPGFHRRHEEGTSIEDPVIVSDRGPHIRQEEIRKLIDSLEV